jgi:multimeric flavodoxin WrbA
MKIKKLQEYNKKRILIFIGSARSKDNCPGQDSKTSKIVLQSIKDLPKDIELDIIDLAIEPDKPIIQPCKGCISTAGGAHCHFPCDCYFKKDKKHPDLMSDFDIYKRILKADAFIVFTPINWWSVSSQVKAMFDRLVCGSLTITVNQADELWGENKKNARYTKKFSSTEEYKQMVKNHYEGKVGAFYIHGDDGADDYVDRKLPKSLTKYEIGKFNEPKNAILPIVWQCRYMGIDVPEELIEAFYMNEEISYSDANDKLKEGKLGFAVKKAKKLIEDTYKYLK